MWNTANDRILSVGSLVSRLPRLPAQGSCHSHGLAFPKWQFELPFPWIGILRIAQAYYFLGHFCLHRQEPTCPIRLIVNIISISLSPRSYGLFITSGHYEEFIVILIGAKMSVYIQLLIVKALEIYLDQASLNSNRLLLLMSSLLCV